MQGKGVRRENKQWLNNKSCTVQSQYYYNILWQKYNFISYQYNKKQFPVLLPLLTYRNLLYTSSQVNTTIERARESERGEGQEKGIGSRQNCKRKTSIQLSMASDIRVAKGPERGRWEDCNCRKECFKDGWGDKMENNVKQMMEEEGQKYSKPPLVFSHTWQLWPMTSCIR